MSILKRVDWKVLECVILEAGFVFKAEKNEIRQYDHRTLKNLTVVIQKTNRKLDTSTIKMTLSRAKLSLKEYSKFLSVCQ